ncbi:molybdopterin-dependent oxidoreductase [uncultured Chryseobacterium sp.]|uniref:molybdopterin-dependent oxidoreductase n=1 Tax=uncultured Chryseobacterium sp. TaxID=259322 RepID=UPI00262E6695|nr:molybdopterin-dependent oxidoreductase [uncultured Chryseobacterium sp.]
MRKFLKFIWVVAMTYPLLQCSKPEAARPEVQSMAHISENISEKENQKPNDDNWIFVNTEVAVMGDVFKPLTLTVDSLKKMNVKEIKDFDIVSHSGITKEHIKSVKGVLLKEILEKAKISQQDHTDRNFYIVARASDDYKATFSWAELFNNPTGDKTYVVFEKDEKPLKEEGEMILISLSDTKTDTRHVKWLKSIEVTRVQ